MKRKLISMILAASLIAGTLLSACGTEVAPETPPAEQPAAEEAAAPEEAAPEAEEPAEEETAEGSDTKFTEDEQAVYAQVNDGEGMVNTFIGRRFCDHTVTNEQEALDCANEVIKEIGGDETTTLVFHGARTNEDGMSVVTLSQRVGEVMAYGATVKIILDKDDYPIGMVSSIIPNVDIRDINEWAVDDKEAEKVVMEELKKENIDGTLVEDATEKAVIPNPDDDKTGRYICVWVVYTFNINKGRDDQAYTAHYVSAEGKYLYNIPVAEPGVEDAATGQSAKNEFDFDAYTPEELKVKIRGKDGKDTEEVTVPVLKDEKTGKTYLADAERQILCAWQAPFFYEEGVIEPVETDDGVDPVDAVSYYNYIRVWDYYASKGWVGPDGEGTPSLLLMNYLDQEGKPEDNACYVTKIKGFQVFAWSRSTNFGGCIDVVAHEMTHCVTTNTMTYNIYENDMGSINEGYSDIMGNVIEMMIEGEDEEGAWLIAENIGSPIRNMAEPHDFAQPEFAWDTYYAPKPIKPTGMNDKGGVHINNSLLSRVSYRLYEAGMKARDQGYYWLNTALVISPQCDYPIMATILPWVMEQLGYEEYLDALNAAIEEAKFTATEPTAEIPEGCGTMTFDFAPVKELMDEGRVSVTYFHAPDADVFTRITSWPTEGTSVATANIPEGDYFVVAGVSDESGQLKRQAAYGEDGWVILENYRDSKEVSSACKTISLKAGEKIEIPNEGFKEASDEMIKIIDEIMSALE